MLAPASQHQMREVTNGVRWICTTAGARTPEEEVPINPLPDQVNPNGWDPEETDSDADSEDEEPQSQDVRSSEDDDYTPRVCGASTRIGSRPSSYTARTERRNADLSTAIPVKTQLPACSLGAVELLTFFPHHTQYPELGLRLYRNDWNTQDISKMQLHGRGRLSRARANVRAATMRKQVLRNGAVCFNDKNFTQAAYKCRMTPVITYDASAYASPSRVVLRSAFLVDIASGVVNWPTGQDRGIVTQAIEHAQQNDLNQLTTADIPRLAQQQGFVAPTDAGTPQWDQRALGRAQQIMKQAGTCR